MWLLYNEGNEQNNSRCPRYFEDKGKLLNKRKKLHPITNKDKLLEDKFHWKGKQEAYSSISRANIRWSEWIRNQIAWEENNKWYQYTDTFSIVTITVVVLCQAFGNFVN